MSTQSRAAVAASPRASCGRAHAVVAATRCVCVCTCARACRYPATARDFAALGLRGTFDADLAGTRMKLAVPHTWETQLSARGNTAAVWEELLQSRSVPFMAMLRNLRNVIQARVRRVGSVLPSQRAD